MNKEDTLVLLKGGVVEVTFNKVNGDERVMSCTLQESVLPETKGTDKKIPEGNQVVYDINAEGFRTFKWENVTKVTGKAFSKPKDAA